MIAALFSVCLVFAQTQPPPGDAAPDPAKLKSDLDRANRTLQDWANLKRYHEDNAKVAPPAPGEERVVLMGDSITDGWGKRYGKFFPGKPYINRGISGQTTPQMLIRFRPDVIALKPKAVVILAGTTTSQATPDRRRWRISRAIWRAWRNWPRRTRSRSYFPA
jgi:GDSL-like Lipase/Acylhydrolase family